MPEKNTKQKQTKSYPAFTFQRNITVQESPENKTSTDLSSATQETPKHDIELAVEMSLITNIPLTPSSTPDKIKSVDFYHEAKSLATSTVIFSMEFDNDVYFQTDYYYTNGVSFELIHPSLEKSFLSRFLWPFDNFPEVYYGIRFTHKMYTPTQLDIQDVLADDRPFAGYLKLSHFKIAFDPVRKARLSSSLGMGVMGPAAFGGQLQDFIHDDIPVGWGNQIRNDIVFDYGIVFEKSIFASRKFEIIHQFGGHVGSLRDYLKAGLSVNYGNYSVFNSINGFNFHSAHNRLNYGFYLQANGNLVGYDATLQGGIMNTHSVYTMRRDELKSFRYNISGGFVLQYAGISFNARANYNSPEFSGGRPHKWLHLGLSVLLN